MAKLQLSVAMGDYDRTRALLDGRVIKQFGATRQHRYGFCYLRLRSTARAKDENGLLVESVSVRVK